MPVLGPQGLISTHKLALEPEEVWLPGCSQPLTPGSPHSHTWPAAAQASELCLIVTVLGKPACPSNPSLYIHDIMFLFPFTLTITVANQCLFMGAFG